MVRNAQACIIGLNLCYPVCWCLQDSLTIKKKILALSPYIGRV